MPRGWGSQRPAAAGRPAGADGSQIRGEKRRSPHELARVPRWGTPAATATTGLANGRGGSGDRQEDGAVAVRRERGGAAVQRTVGVRVPTAGGQRTPDDA